MSAAAGSSFAPGAAADRCSGSRAGANSCRRAGSCRSKGCACAAKAVTASSFTGRWPDLMTLPAAQALRDFRSAIGDDWVMTDESDRLAYSDHFAADESHHRPAGAVAPADTAQVREIVRIANR